MKEGTVGEILPTVLKPTVAHRKNEAVPKPIYIYVLHHKKKYIYIYIQYGSPPRAYLGRGGGNVSLTKCGVEYIQRHAQKTL